MSISKANNKYFFILPIIIFIFCINLEKEHWQNFNNFDINSNYYLEFTDFTLNQIKKYKIGSHNWERNYDKSIENQLEQREKTRWVFLKLVREISILSSNIAKKQKYISYEKAFLQIHSFFTGIIIFLIFVFYHLTLKRLKSYDIDDHKSDSFNIIYSSFTFLFLIFYIYFVHFRGARDEFSLYETLALIMSIYFILLKNNLGFIFYFVLCFISPLIRESAILISIIYILFYFINNKQIKFSLITLPIISIIPYIYFNFDIFNFYFKEGFMFTTKEISSQTDWHDLKSNFFGTLNALFYNFIVFFVPLIIFYKNSKINNFLLLIIVLYFILLIFGSVLDRTVARFMPSILILVYIYSTINIKNFKYQ